MSSATIWALHPFPPSPMHQNMSLISAASWSSCWHPPAEAEGEVQFQESGETFSHQAGWVFPRWPLWKYWGQLGCWHSPPCSVVLKVFSWLQPHSTHPHTPALPPYIPLSLKSGNLVYGLLILKGLSCPPPQGFCPRT